eukprot:CAMPEP_0194254896 /NCGR_PEP_ID=MMETSP0158-20130606/33169_1 /TAXON_ID=33649 /ORGANISM="Thalassionema nitzschioides, Strain L26-B" /LENGTH=739 /DNA_ID=CAMNT_0038993105 /DNA_START=143 /DNA_END=2363 /DNA_ORIENTATION=-
MPGFKDEIKGILDIVSTINVFDVHNRSMFSSLPDSQMAVLNDGNSRGNGRHPTILGFGKDGGSATEVELLLQKAKELRNEASTAELALRSTKQKANDMKNAKSDQIYDEFRTILDPPEGSEIDDIDVLACARLCKKLANVLSERRFSSKTMEQLVVRLYERFLSAESKIPTAIEDFNLGDVSNSEEYIESELRLLWYIDCIIDAQALVDKDESSNSVKPVRGLAPVLEARVKALKKVEQEKFQRELELTLNKIPGDKLVGNLSEQTLGEENMTIKIGGKDISGPKSNITRLIENVIQTPDWVPSCILPFLAVCPREIEEEIFVKIRSEILGVSSFNVEYWDFTRTAAIYRGNFVDRERAALYGTNSITASDNSEASEGGKQIQVQRSTVVFQEIQDRLEKAGLTGEVQLFLMEDPEWRPGDRDPQPLPTILALSSSVVPEQGAERGIGQKFLSVIALFTTLTTTLAFATSGFALNPTFFDAVVLDISKLSLCLPVVFGVLAINAFHEVAHQIAARSSGLKIALPVPLPSLQVGTFGSITALRSFPKSRAAIFDFAMSGPVTGAIISIFVIIIGMFLTVQASPEELSTFAVVPAVITKTSFLVGIITSTIAPDMMAIPDSQLMPIHPIFLVGFAGVVASALNLMPIGRLDGGRASMAIVGRRTSYLVSLASFTILAIAALTQTSGMSISWGLLLTLFQRNADIPIRDEFSELDDFRVGVYISCIVMAALILAPFPGGPVL